MRLPTVRLAGTPLLHRRTLPERYFPERRPWIATAMAVLVLVTVGLLVGGAVGMVLVRLVGVLVAHVTIGT
ncbi:hypothetical protein [Nocardioides sp. zg-1228]|uniref:hypothetical protein n=1 Tax=Nocardioides sp. zg-1228 TaxID=2763008 RepID=UPI00164361A8|nr:hypothetical protein [Nocardioides sp. zg-1228]MBC2933969.1 hypothetical protein [Nocardioides sp. zg-1228]QSF58728.1 hypothetical protein JX575_05945 [Nocardioides sp. zg-1228]